MVDVQSSNLKLVDRARRIFRAILIPLVESDPTTHPSIDVSDDAELDKLIKECGGSVKTALVAARWSCGAEEARKRLEGVDGILKRALEG